MSRARPHLLPMPLALVALLAGMWGGLLKLGWGLPAVHPALALVHGPLMIGGFLGTLISLERAVALGRHPAMAAPALAALGAVASIVAPGRPLGALLLTLSSVALVAVAFALARRQTRLVGLCEVAGALLWLAGNLIWLLDGLGYAVVLSWACFPLLTILGERLELSRLRMLSTTSRALFLGAAAMLPIGALLTDQSLAAGLRCMGAGELALAAWLWRYDLARQLLRSSGLQRFIGVSLLSGFCWLGVGGLFSFLAAADPTWQRYDALLHAVFLGFTMTMIFAHAPIILPAVAGVPQFFRPAFYLHVGLLQATLLLRVMGDLIAWFPATQWGGMLNVATIVIFLANTLLAVKRAQRQVAAAVPG